MGYRVVKTTDVKLCEALHTIIFPLDEWEEAEAYWIVVGKDEEVVGFASCSLVDGGITCYFMRAGLLPHARGSRLQRRLIKAREKWASEQEGVTNIITYVKYSNHASLVTLIKSGYRFYTPARPWAGEVHYFIKPTKLSVLQ